MVHTGPYPAECMPVYAGLAAAASEEPVDIPHTLLVALTSIQRAYGKHLILSQVQSKYHLTHMQTFKYET